MSLKYDFIFPSIITLLQHNKENFLQKREIDAETTVFLRILTKYGFKDDNLTISNSEKKGFLKAIEQRLNYPVSPLIEDELIIRSNLFLTKIAFNKFSEPDIINFLDFLNNWVYTARGIPPKSFLYLFDLLGLIKLKYNLSNNIDKNLNTIGILIKKNNDQRIFKFFTLLKKIVSDVKIVESDFNFFFKLPNPISEEIWLISEFIRLISIAEINELRLKLFSIIYLKFKMLLDKLFIHKSFEISYADLLLFDSIFNLGVKFSPIQLHDFSTIRIFQNNEFKEFFSELGYIEASVYDLLVLTKEILNNFEEANYNRAGIFILHNALEITCKYILFKDLNMKRKSISGMKFDDIVEKIKINRRSISRKGTSLQRNGFNEKFFSDIHHFREIRNDLQHKGAGFTVEKRLVIHFLEIISGFCDCVFEKDSSNLFLSQ